MRNEPDAAATVGKWIAETTVERRRMEALLRAQPTTKLTRDDIRALVESLRDIAAALEAADPADKAAVYCRARHFRHLPPGPPRQRTVPAPCSYRWCRRGDLNPHED